MYHLIALPYLFFLIFKQSLAEVDRLCYGRLRLFGLYIRVSVSKAVRDAAAAARTMLDSFQTQMLYLCLHTFSFNDLNYIIVSHLEHSIISLIAFFL